MEANQIKHLISNSKDYFKLAQQVDEHPSEPYSAFIENHIIMKSDFDAAASVAEVSSHDRKSFDTHSATIVALENSDRSGINDAVLKGALDDIGVLHQRLIDRLKSKYFRASLNASPRYIDISEFEIQNLESGAILLGAHKFFFESRDGNVTHQTKISKACVTALNAFCEADKVGGDWVHIDTWQEALENNYGVKTPIKEIFNRSDRSEATKMEMKKLFELTFENSPNGEQYRKRKGVRFER